MGDGHHDAAGGHQGGGHGLHVRVVLPAARDADPEELVIGIHGDRRGTAEADELDPLGRAMMERDPKLASEFLGKVASDTTFARDPRARADWFYRRSPWNDADQDLHPFARLSRRVPEGSLVPLPGTAPVAAPAPTVAPTPRKR